MPVLVGTSGWQYRHWRGGIYPAGVPQTQWLEHYASLFATVELNNAFYRLPDASTFAGWAARLPGDFIVAVKASRYLTHIRRLREPRQPVGLLVERASSLGDRLGPFLLQLPPNLKVNAGALAETLEAFPRRYRVAVEPRHSSWFCDEVAELLRDRDAALCLVDGGPAPAPYWRTASWGYVRFHGGRAQPPSCYGRTALETWARRVAQLWQPNEDVYVYFNNDLHGCAPRDARVFAAACDRAGRRPSRVPAARDTPLT
ncbi:MAG: DUF72 domain-containing protein [Acidimicrobiaceae bacterium]|nr:DUF72 domain-containing protein [Acidimicrobiaceae bacterium]